jgi:hypothetical protein
MPLGQEVVIIDRPPGAIGDSLDHDRIGSKRTAFDPKREFRFSSSFSDGFLLPRRDPSRRHLDSARGRPLNRRRRRRAGA